MKKYITFIEKNRKICLILFALITLFMITGITRLKISTNFDIFKITNSDYQADLKTMEEVFGSNKQLLLIVETQSDPETLIDSIDNKLNNNHFKFASPKDIQEVIDPIIEKNNMFYISYFLDVSDKDQLYNLKSILEAENLTYYLSGDYYMQDEILTLITKVLKFIPPLALFFVVLIFRSQLSSFKATILSVMPAGVSALWTMGIIGWIGQEVSIITVLAPIFAIVIGSADGLHFVTHMEEEFAQEKKSTDALSHTLSIVGLPMIITTTTSVSGFMALFLIDTEVIRSLALFASIGVTLAGIITWFILPVIFSSNVRLSNKKRLITVTFLTKLWGRRSIVITGVLLIISLSFIPRINSEFNQFLFFRSFTDVQKNVEKIVEINDGAIPLYYYGTSTLENIKEDLPKISASISEIEKLDSIVKVINPIPNIDLSTGFDLNKLSKAKSFIRIENNIIHYRFMVFPKDLKNATIGDLQSFEGYDTGKIIGVQMLMKEMNEVIVKGQVKSVIFTYVLILIMLIFTLKSLKLSFIATLPIIFTSIILYGFLGLSGIPLNVMTSTIFSITLGIGIDYAIHYMSVYRYFKDTDDVTPIETAYMYTSRPIIANAFGLALGMTALFISPLLLHLHIASLMWIAMISSVFLSLTILPSILKKFDY